MAIKTEKLTVKILLEKLLPTKMGTLNLHPIQIFMVII